MSAHLPGRAGRTRVAIRDGGRVQSVSLRWEPVREAPRLHQCQGRQQHPCRDPGGAPRLRCSGRGSPGGFEAAWVPVGWRTGLGCSGTATAIVASPGAAASQWCLMTSMWMLRMLLRHSPASKQVLRRSSPFQTRTPLRARNSSDRRRSLHHRGCRLHEMSAGSDASRSDRA